MPTTLTKVLILYVGGTIGMKKNEKGAYVPIPNAFFEKLHAEIHQEELTIRYRLALDSNQLVFEEGSVIICEFKEYDPLLDSSNMTTCEWITIANDIQDNYCEFDGFVVLHGTDTLSFTASALSFMLDGLRKPVVITGSQISMFEMRNDAKCNILSAVNIAANCDIPEVCVFFANKLLRGNRTTKVSSTQMSAFDSPNYHCLAQVGIDVTVHDQFIRKPGGKLNVFSRLNENVGVVTIVPTITAPMLQSLLQPPLDGAVLVSFGVGNIPTNTKGILSVLEEAVERGVLIVNITQCFEGTVSAVYEPGQILMNIGIIPGNDMTLEAALTKLSYVLGLPNISREDKIKLMKTDLCGEFTNMEINNNCN